MQQNTQPRASSPYSDSNSPLLEFMKCDAANAENALRSLHAVCPHCLRAVDCLSSFFDAIGRDWAPRCTFDKDQQLIETWARQLHISPEDHAGLLSAARLLGPVSDDPTAVAHAAFRRALNADLRANMIARLKRDILCATVEMLHLRPSVSMGHTRLSAESYGYIKLSREQPDLGMEWLISSAEDRSKDFYKKWQGKVVGAIKDLGIHLDYATGSNMAMHPTSLSMAGGLLMDDNIFQFHFQETDHPVKLLFWLARTIHMHQVALMDAPALLQEFSQDELNHRGLAEFRSLADCTWQVTRRLYLQHFGDSDPSSRPR